METTTTQQKKVGAGSFGEVYEDPNDPTKIIKVVNPCGKTDFLNRQICESVSTIENVPRGACRDTVYRPNEFNEIAAGMDLSAYEIIVKVFTYEIKGNHQAIMVQEKCKTDILSVLRTDVDWCYFFFYLSFNLMRLQQDHKFVHYDLHYGNVFYVDSPPIIHENLNAIFKGFKWHPKIGDFGMTRYSVGRSIYLPRVNDYPDRSYGKFIPYYDFYSMFFSLVLMGYSPTGKKPNPSQVLINSDPKIKAFIDNLFRFMFRDNLKNFEEVLPGFSTKASEAGNIINWRITATIGIVNRIRTMSEVTEYLFGEFLKLSGKFQDPKDIQVWTEVLTRACNLDFTVKYPKVEIPKMLSNTVSTSYFDKRLVYRYQPLPAFQTNIHIFLLNKNTLKKSEFVCCDQDYYEFFQGLNKGLTITGTAFRYHTGDARVPVGTYYDGTFEYTNPIPIDYVDDFKFVTFDINHNLVIMSEDNQEYDNIMTAGPVLINKSKILFTDDKINHITDAGKYKYRCDSDQDPKAKNCENLQPGDLSHANSILPRTCMGQKGEGLYLILIEGGVSNGVTMFTLAKICHENLNLENCINLDNGGISIISWKEDFNIYTTHRSKEYQTTNLIHFDFLGLSKEEVK